MMKMKVRKQEQATSTIELCTLSNNVRRYLRYLGTYGIIGEDATCFVNTCIIATGIPVVGTLPC